MKIQTQDPHLLKLHLSTALVKRIVIGLYSGVETHGAVGPVDFTAIARSLVGATCACLFPEDAQLVVSDFTRRVTRGTTTMLRLDL